MRIALIRWPLAAPATRERLERQIRKLDEDNPNLEYMQLMQLVCDGAYSAQVEQRLSALASRSDVRNGPDPSDPHKPWFGREDVQAASRQWSSR